MLNWLDISKARLDKICEKIIMMLLNSFSVPSHMEAVSLKTCPFLARIMLTELRRQKVVGHL